MGKGVHLTIRTAQWRAFEREVVLAGLLRGHAEEVAAAGVDAVCARVEAALERAEALGFTEPAEQGRFAELRLLLGDAFDATPWASAILAWDRPSEVKLSALEARAQREQLRRAGWTG